MTGPITADHTPAPAAASRPDRPRSSAEREAAILAAATGASIEVPVTGLPGLPPRRFAAPLTAAVAQVPAVTAALILSRSCAVWHLPLAGTGPEHRWSCRTPRPGRSEADHQLRPRRNCAILFLWRQTAVQRQNDQSRALGSCITLPHGAIDLGGPGQKRQNISGVFLEDQFF